MTRERRNELLQTLPNGLRQIVKQLEKDMREQFAEYNGGAILLEQWWNFTDLLHASVRECGQYVSERGSK